MEFIGEALATVGEPERAVVALLYGFDGPRHAPEEIAQLRGLSLRQIEETVKKVVRRMRHPLCARIIREAVAAAEERIWRSLAGAFGIVDKKSLAEVSALVPGELLFAVECVYGSLEEWLAAHARPAPRGWYRSPFPETEIERITARLAQADEFPLPKPLETLARDMHVEAAALSTAVRIQTPFRQRASQRLYSGYVAEALGARAPRMIRLHRILSGAHRGEIVPRRRLLGLYRSKFIDDDCTLYMAESSMAFYRHLFLGIGDLGWCGIGAAGQESADRPVDASVVFSRWSEERKSQQDTLDAEVIRQILEVHGPLPSTQILQLVRKQLGSNIHSANVGQMIHTYDEIERLAPGVYGLYGQPAGDSQWAAARKHLLNPNACLQYVAARLAGEPADAYLLWTPQMEAAWCEWAQDTQQKLLGSLLAVVDPSSWPIPDSDRAAWQWKKECWQYFRYEDLADYPLDAVPLVDLLAALKCARWRGSANWVMANRATGRHLLSDPGASLMMLLVGVGAVLPASHWQLPHAIAPCAGEIDDMLSAELHRKASLSWDGDSGRWLLDRLTQSIDCGETGWAQRPELKRLLGLLRDSNPREKQTIGWG